MARRWDAAGLRAFVRSLAGSAALLLVTLALLAGGGELLLRSSDSPDRGARPFDIYRPSSTLTHELRPNWSGRFTWNDFDVQVNINASGFRGPPVSTEEAPEVWRILVVGDSFAFGWGVEQNEMFPAVLQAELDSAGVRAEVIDAGVPGYAADDHLIFLRERGFDLHPDLILVAVCGNDTDELAWTSLRLGQDRLPIASLSTHRFINQRGEMRFLNDAGLDLPPALLPEAWSDWLYENSVAFRWLRIRFTKAWITHVAAFAAAHAALPPDEVPSEPIETLSAAQIGRALSHSAEFRLRYHRYLMQAITRESAARGIRVRSLLTEGAEEGLRRDCAASPCLDQANIFRRERDPGTYLALDGHWSARGHAMLGQALTRWLLADPDLGLRAPPVHAAAPTQP